VGVAPEEASGGVACEAVVTAAAGGGLVRSRAFLFGDRKCCRESE